MSEREPWRVVGVPAQPNASLCPQIIRESIDRYVQDGVPTGSFLLAVLENDLREAIARADHINVWALPHIVAYLYNHVPAPVWGSADAVARHLKAKRNERRAAEERERAGGGAKHVTNHQMPLGAPAPTYNPPEVDE